MAESDGKKIFIAGISDQISWFRQNLKLELENNGYSVGFSDDFANDHDKIPEILPQYDVAIHLLSDSDNVITTTGKGLEEQLVLYSVQHHLNRRLFSALEDDQFKVFAWHPKSRSENIYVEESLAPHIKRIQQLEEVELLRTNFEEFKSYLFSGLEKQKIETIDQQYIKGSENQSIYFLHDTTDLAEAQRFVSYLKKRGYEVYTPQLKGDILSVRQAHNQSLINFDLAIIFANTAAISWVNMKIMDLLKASGLGREKEIAGKAVFMPAQKFKMCPLAQRGFQFIEYLDGGSEEMIDPFLNKNQV